MPTTKPKSGQRYRICGTPSRLGCVTCKIRRVKCGEEKPFCKRCTSTGRKCDGYGPPKQATTGNNNNNNTGSSNAVVRRTSNAPQSNPSTTMANPMEEQLLYFFATATAPSLTGAFSSDFWQQKVVGMSMVEPTVRHAVVAISAIHQNFVNKHHCREKDGGSSKLETFAFRQYTKAISSLHNLMSKRAHQMDLTLIACILFICIDCLLGNHASAIIHLKAGLRILQNIKLEKEHRGICAEEWERNYSPPLIALGVQAATFVSPHLTAERTELWTFLTTAGLHSKPMVFTNLDTARYALDTICAEIMTDRTTTHSIISHVAPDPSGVIAQKHIAALTSWSQALELFIHDHVSLEPTATHLRQGATLLKVHSLVVSIVIGRIEDAREKFEDILALCDYLITTGGCFTSPITNLNFATDQGVIAPLFFVAMRAPCSVAKSRALALLARAPGREGMWDTEDAMRVVEAASAVQHMQRSRTTDCAASASASASATALAHPPTTPTVAGSDLSHWIDVAARLKSKKSWPFGERAPILDREAFLGREGGSMQMGPVRVEAPDFTPQFAWLLRKKRDDSLELDLDADGDLDLEV